MFFDNKTNHQNNTSFTDIFTCLIFVVLYYLIYYSKKYYFAPRVYIYRTDKSTEFKRDNNNAGVDLRLAEKVIVSAGECVKVYTTVAINIPSGMHGIIKERSSVGCMGVILGGGVIDSGYTAVISLIMINTSRFDREFQEGDRVAQIVFAENVNYSVHFVNECKDLPYKQRGIKGFGSTNISPPVIQQNDDGEIDNKPAYNLRSNVFSFPKKQI